MVPCSCFGVFGPSSPGGGSWTRRVKTDQPRKRHETAEGRAAPVSARQGLYGVLAPSPREGSSEHLASVSSKGDGAEYLAQKIFCTRKRLDL
jgi:hypothetical protein